MDKMTHHSLLSMICGEPLLISEAALRMVMNIAAREAITPEMVQQYRGVPVAGTRKLEIRSGGVGIIPVNGPIFRHANLMREISGATTVQSIAEDLGVAVQTKEIQSIVLAIDSPGGQANGMAELAGMIREANQVKPVTSYVSYQALSGGQLLAASAGKVVAHKWSFHGCIGAVAAWKSTKGMEESLGIKDIVIVSSSSPKKGLDPETPEGMKEIQKGIDFLGESFIDEMAKFRGVSRKKVREEFGQGADLDAPAALSVGLIDSLDTMEGVIRAVGGGRRYRPTSVSVAASSGGPEMTWKDWFSSNGSKPNDEVPDSILKVHQDTADRGGKKDEDDPAELKRQLAAERQGRLQAETKLKEGVESSRQAAIATEKNRIEATVRSWVGKAIHPYEEKDMIGHCLHLADMDRTQGTKALEAFTGMMERRKLAGITDEVVVNQKPPAGGTIQDGHETTDIDAKDIAEGKRIARMAATSNGRK